MIWTLEPWFFSGVHSGWRVECHTAAVSLYLRGFLYDWSREGDIDRCRAEAEAFHAVVNYVWGGSQS